MSEQSIVKTVAWVCFAVVLSSGFLSIGWANSGPKIAAPRFVCETLP